MKKEEMKSIRPLIVSYSYSGNTQRIAREIQTVTGGDWSEIYPWQPYPMAFPELLEQVRREIRSGCRPRLLENFRSPRPYGVIFVGFPRRYCQTVSQGRCAGASGNCRQRRRISAGNSPAVVFQNRRSRNSGVERERGGLKT